MFWVPVTENCDGDNFLYKLLQWEKQWTAERRSTIVELCLALFMRSYSFEYYATLHHTIRATSPQSMYLLLSVMTKVYRISSSISQLLLSIALWFRYFRRNSHNKSVSSNINFCWPNFSVNVALHKRISSVNATKSADCCGFGYIYWRTL